MTEPDQLASVREVYNATAEAYGQLVGTEMSAAFEGPVDRALLAAFVELTGPTALLVADVGCGPGRAAAFLADRGLNVVGVDVSQAMLTVARSAHPGIRFEEGRLTALPFSDRSLGGAVLRAGSTEAVLGHDAMAPSTCGTFLRSFTFGHIRQLDQLTAEILGRAWAAHSRQP